MKGFVPLAALAAVATPAVADGTRQSGATVVMPQEPANRKIWEEWGLSDAIVAGDHVYLSGVVASLRPGETDPKAAFDRAFARIDATLKRAGSSWDDVVDMTSYHTDVTTQMAPFIAVKRRYVRAPFPAWTAIDIDRLIPEGGIAEIKVTAIRGKRQAATRSPSVISPSSPPSQ